MTTIIAERERGTFLVLVKDSSGAPRFVEFRIE
jgi:hypothetical protein